MYLGKPVCSVAVVLLFSVSWMDAFCQRVRESIGADVRLDHGNEQVAAGLGGGGFFVDFVSVEGKTGFQAKNVPGSKAAGNRALVHQRTL